MVRFNYRDETYAEVESDGYLVGWIHQTPDGGWVVSQPVADEHTAKRVAEQWFDE